MIIYIIFMNDSFPAAACRTTHLLGFCLLPWFWSQLFKFGQWCIATKSLGSCKTSTETHQILIVSKASSARGARADTSSKYPGNRLRIMTSLRTPNNFTFPATALTLQLGCNTLAVQTSRFWGPDKINRDWNRQRWVLNLLEYSFNVRSNLTMSSQNTALKLDPWPQ